MNREIEILPAWDKRSHDPKLHGGMSGCLLIFTLTGEKGAVRFEVQTNWHSMRTRSQLFDVGNWKMLFPFAKRVVSTPQAVTVDDDILDFLLEAMIESGSEGVFLTLEKIYQFAYHRPHDTVMVEERGERVRP